MKTMLSQSLYYLRSMRVYLFLLSGTAGWLGIVYSGFEFDLSKTILISLILFVGWGVNQVLNDILGLKEDKINAPHRPLVTGDLSLRFAVIISLVLFVLGIFVTFLLNKYAIWLYLLSFILNYLYEYLKRIPLLGNIVFGLILSTCVFYSAMCLGGTTFSVIIGIKEILVASYIVFIANFVCVFYTYFKDYEGDKRTGIKTIVVALGREKSSKLNIGFGLIPTLLIPFFIYQLTPKFSLNWIFLTLIFLYSIINFKVIISFGREYTGKKVYYFQKWSFLSAILYQAIFISIPKPAAGMVLFVASYIAVLWLFGYYKDYKG